MRNTHFALILSVLLLSVAATARAGKLYVSSSLDRDGSLGHYYGVTILASYADDPPTNGIGVQVESWSDGSLAFSATAADVLSPASFPWPAHDEIDVLYDYDLPPDGGCVVGHIWSRPDVDWIREGTASSPQMCWPVTSCHLHDWVNTEGYITPGLATGTYTCGTCLNEIALPNIGFQFDGWTGDVVSTALVVNICLNGDKSITGNFSRIPPPPDGPEGPLTGPPDWNAGSPGGGGGTLPPGTSGGATSGGAATSTGPCMFYYQGRLIGSC